MSNVHFFPRLNESLLDKSAYKASEYSFGYTAPDGLECQLQLCSGKSGRLIDAADVWQPRKDGLIIEKTVIIEYPEELKGPKGVIPIGAKLLPCLLWSCPRLSTAGVLKPDEIVEKPRLAAKFHHVFEPGSIDGSIQLKPVLYVGEPALELQVGEEYLMNEPGVLLGDLEAESLIDFTGETMDFPIEEFSEEGGPLWMIQFEDWDDPREDPFTSSSFALLLNAKHPDCPRKVNGQMVNEPLLLEILCEAYFLLYEKVRCFHDDSVWDDMISDSNLTPDSICSVLFWFSQRGDDLFNWSTPESRMLSIKKIVDQSFSGGGVDE